MASEITVARESRAEPINAVSRSGGTREGLLRTMASQMRTAHTTQRNGEISAPFLLSSIIKSTQNQKTL